MNDHVHPVMKAALPILAGDEPALVVKKTNAQFTEYTITGPLRRVLEQIEEVFSRYDPQGYGTALTRLGHRFPGPGYEASMWRSNSCD